MSFKQSTSWYSKHAYYTFFDFHSIAPLFLQLELCYLLKFVYINLINLQIQKKLDVAATSLSLHYKLKLMIFNPNFIFNFLAFLICLFWKCITSLLIHSQL